ncbi:hypothetical protein [Legionella sp. CNM-4043-24]|uniref:hypothetical protein n=1 Tax=Legionella sp. CNM-4043-24 TaxID=3421646 RepID=UPI00403B3622
MAGFFDTCVNPIVNAVKEGAFSSSPTARKGTRVSMGAEVLGSATSYFTPIISIPTSGAQFLISAYLALVADANSAEKLAHSGLSVGALFKLVILSMLLFEHKKCTEDSQDTMCDLGLYAQLIYAGLLIVISVVSESSKAKPDASEPASPVLPVTSPAAALPDNLQLARDEDSDGEPNPAVSPSHGI